MVTTPFPYRISPLNNITPFTHQDGTTYLEILEQLRVYINESLRPEFDTEIGRILEEFNEGISNAEQTVTEAKAGWQTLFDEYMADVEASLMALNESAVTALVNDPESEVGITLRSLFAGIDTETTVNNGRLSTESLISAFASKATETTVNSGRLSAESLTAAFASKATETTVNSGRLSAENLTAAIGDAVTEALLEISVLDHGAVGDGVTDDTAAFNAAMSEIGSAGGGRLIIPPLTYNIPGYVELVDNVHITGYGATLVKTTATSSYAFFAALSNGSTGYGSGCRNVKAEGIEFRGSFTGEFIKTVCAFALHHAQDVLVEQCRFIEAQGTGHTFDLNGCERITIRNCVWEGFLQDATAGYNKAEAVQLDQSANGALSVLDTAGSHDGLFCQDITVDNCRFLPLTIGASSYPCPNPIGTHAHREGKYHRRIRFTNNYILDPIADPADNNADNADLLGVIHLLSTIDCLISGNQFVQTQSRPNRVIGVYTITDGVLATEDPNTSGQTSGAIPPLACENIRITDNSFEGFNATATPQETIYVRGEPDGFITDIIVSGNTFKDGYINDSYPGVTCIKFERVMRGTVDGNSITNYHQAVYPLNCDHISITNNSIIDNNAYSVYVGDCRIIVITGNKVTRSGLGMYLDATTRQPIVANNVYVDGTGIDADARQIVLAGPDYFQVFGNVLYCGPGGGTAMAIYSSATNGKIINNVLVGYDSPAISDSNGGITSVIISGN